MRHIGLATEINDYAENLSCGYPADGDPDSHLMRQGIQLWVDEGPLGGHWRVLHDTTLRSVGCAVRRGSRQDGTSCWVVACNYGR